VRALSDSGERNPASKDGTPAPASTTSPISGTRFAGRTHIAAKIFVEFFVKTFVIAGRLALFASIAVVACATDITDA
jgi:hypothetical protein